MGAKDHHPGHHGRWGDKDAQNTLLSAQGLHHTPRAADIVSARVFPPSQPVFNKG